MNITAIFMLPIILSLIGLFLLAILLPLFVYQMKIKLGHIDQKMAKLVAMATEQRPRPPIIR